MVVYASDIGKDKTVAENAILQAHGNRTGKSVTIDRLSKGKPVVLYDGKREGCISVSHTDGLLVIALVFLYKYKWWHLRYKIVLLEFLEKLVMSNNLI